MSNSFSWNNVNYIIGKKNFSVRWNPFRVVKEMNTRKVLDNVSGQIRSGDMVAIIGSSGAGKTSLMAALCGRIRGKLSGDFSINDEPATKELITSVTGFVPQYETAVAVLTVEEHLRFVVELKLGRSISRYEKWERVESVVKRLGISSLKRTRIKNLSGGEKRKLNLAEELLREPLFLFCDEPTTSLDSFNSKSVMQTLRQLTCNEAEGGTRQAIICSIHQPSSTVFNYFNYIILMDTGRIVYHGKIAEFYKNLDASGMHLPPNYNPAEFFVNLVSPIRFNNLDHDERISQLCELNEQNIMRKSINKLNSSLLTDTDHIEKIQRLPWTLQFLLLLNRAILVGCRDISEAALSSSSNLIIALGIGILYAGKSPNKQAWITDAEGMFFNVIAQIYFNTYMNVVNVFAPELPNIRKETGENLYSISSFYAMKFLSLLPKIFVECILSSIMVYYISSFTRDFDTFLQTTVSYVLLGFTAASYGYMWACLFGDGLALEISMLFDLYQMLSSGIYGAGTIPQAMRYFSLFFFFTEAISYQYWADIDTIECVPGRPCLQNGLEVLHSYSYGQGENTVFFDYSYILGWCLVFHVIAYFSLKRVVLKEGFY